MYLILIPIQIIFAILCLLLLLLSKGRNQPEGIIFQSRLVLRPKQKKS